MLWPLQSELSPANSNGLQPDMCIEIVDVLRHARMTLKASIQLLEQSCIAAFLIGAGHAVPYWALRDSALVSSFDKP